MKRDVTVVIPFYNAGTYLVEAVESVLRQTYPGWTMILVDDGSTDDSVTLIKPYLRNKHIRLIQHSNNMNLSRSLNTALQTVTTPFMIHIDGDDWIYPNTLEVLVKEARVHPDNVAVFTGNINVVAQDPEGRIVAKRIKYGRQYNDKYEFMLANSSVWPRFYRTAALRRVGGWPTCDPYQGAYAEDLHILFRLIEQYRFHWVNVPLLHHRRHSNNQTNQKQELADAVEWIIRDTLERWGGQYTPVFATTNEGWKVLLELKSK